MNILVMREIIILAVIMIMDLLQVGAYAVEIPERGPIPFSAYDRDGDGVISEEEFAAIRQERMSMQVGAERRMRRTGNPPGFSDYDTNGDGILNPDELADGQQSRMQQGNCLGMGRGSGAGQGMGRNRPEFSEFDLNGDGFLLEDEFYKARNKRISERAKLGFPMWNLANAHSFADIDTDTDGMISPEEFAIHQSQCRMQ